MADSTKCFYEILGVSQEAEEDEIQAAFEASKQAFEVSKRVFEASKTAFEVLNDPKKRGAYDRKKAKENEKELKKKEGQERDVDDKCNEQIIGHFPAKVNFSFDILEKLEEQNLLHIRDQIFGALDDRDINNCSQVSKSWQNFMTTNCHMRKKMLRSEMGEIGGAGHFWGNDGKGEKLDYLAGLFGGVSYLANWPIGRQSYCDSLKETRNGGVRDPMGDEDLKKVLLLLAAGQKKVNLKFGQCDNLEVAESGWTIQFKTADKIVGGDGKYFYLWISNKEGGARFKAIAQEIHYRTGEEANRRELQSEKDGTRQRINYEKVVGYGCFIRFNITFL